MVDLVHDELSEMVCVVLFCGLCFVSEVMGFFVSVIDNSGAGLLEMIVTSGFAVGDPLPVGQLRVVRD